MGLDTSHDCWHGPYSSFREWRETVACIADIPYGLMEGFYPYPIDAGKLSEARRWLYPRDGGYFSRRHFGPILTQYIDYIESWLPIKWESLKPDIIHNLLNHSDCEGIISTYDCAELADRLEKISALGLRERFVIPNAESWHLKTNQFIIGLRLAASRGEDVEFR